MTLALSAVCELLKRGDQVSIAIDIFQHLETLGPLPIPRGDISRELAPYLTGSKTSEPTPEVLREAYMSTVEVLAARSKAIEENKRRLRASMWAEATLRAAGEPDYSEMLREWHRDRWGIDEVSSDYSEREKQITSALKQRAHGRRQAA